jgi:hypothetical protein
MFAAIRLASSFVSNFAANRRPARYLFVCSVAGPGVGMPGEPVVIVGNPEHDCLSRTLFYRSSKGTHFLTSLSPMIWVISQRHRWWWVISHHLQW